MINLSKLAYTAAALAAIAVVSACKETTPDHAAFSPDPALLTGEMSRVSILDAPIAVPDVPYSAPDGSDARLSDHAGEVVLLNLWATWCPPCRAEMPHLSQLADDMPDLTVLAIATGGTTPKGAQRFFDEIGVTNLALNIDTSQGLARQMGALGLPVTVLIDRDGYEVARLSGEANWASDEAKDLLAALIAQTP